ncbi:hypothetical protein [Halovivax sp.]|uniref:DUF7282 domain-containing protein n=1 Tax=Halovivax sp. TaxID=1935978 RepID=UPI0025BDB203|nr:hypothetical protein [Halovivax sp.]
MRRVPSRARRVLFGLLVGAAVVGMLASAAGLSVGGGPALGPDEASQSESIASEASVGGANAIPNAEAGGPSVSSVDAAEEVEIVTFEENPGADDPPADSRSDADRDAAITGAEKGIELAQEQGVTVTQTQRMAAKAGAVAATTQYQDASVEQIQGAATGAVHGALLQDERAGHDAAARYPDDAAVHHQEDAAVQHQSVSVAQLQQTVLGGAAGALSQHQTADVKQVQNAAWGASHGALDQRQEVTVEQLQRAARGAAAGAAHAAGEKGIDRVGPIQEAAQGAAHGALDAKKDERASPRQHVAQRQEITVEQIQHAAAGAAAGVLEGTQEQRVSIDQEQRVTIKQVQKAAMGAAKGALDQKQAVTVEQTQVAARGAGKGALSITQIQHVEITQIQKAARGAATGAIHQSQEATIEQIQSAADGAAKGALVQKQTVDVTQVQHAARGAALGAVESAKQHQIVDVKQIQAASRGAAKGAVKQTQTVNVHQVQAIARGASKGSLSAAQEQRVTVAQIQRSAAATCPAVAKAIQDQRVTVEQVQRIGERTAADTTRGTAEAGLDREADVRERADASAVDRTAEEETVDGEATVTVAAERTTDGTAVTIDDVSLSEGGFVAVHDAGWQDGERVDSVIGVSEYLDPGDHEDVTVTLFADVPGVEFDDDALGPGQHDLVAVAYHDVDDDGQFDYVATDGEDDPPYVRQGGEPIADVVTATVAEERTADLGVDDLAGDGETLTVDSAVANVEYYVEARYDGDIVQSELFEAGETVGNLTVDLDPPLEDDADVEVAIRAVEDGEDLEATDIEYTVEEAPVEPTAELVATDRTADGETLSVDRATADVDFYVETSYDGETVRSQPFDAGTAIENLTLELDPPLEADVDVNVSVRAAEDDAELAAEEIRYTVEVPIERTAELDVTDQTGQGETLTVDRASASEEYYVEASYDGEIVETEPFEANETVENLSLDLVPPLEADVDVTVAVKTTEDGEALETTVIEYVVEEEPVERAAELDAPDQTGEGETLTVDRVTADVEYVVEARYDGEAVATEPFEADETVQNLTLDLEPPIDDDVDVTVAVVAAADDEDLETTGIRYTVEEPVERTAELEVSDQAGDGETLTVERAFADEAFYVEARYGDEVVESQGFEADETVQNLTIDLEPPTEDDAVVEVSVRAAADGDPLATEEIEYALEEVPTAALTFPDQESDGATVIVESVELSEGGFVAVYEDGAVDAAAGEVDHGGILGVSERLDSGAHEDVELALYTDVPGAQFEAEALEPGEHDLVAVAHQDDTDTGEFEFVAMDGAEDAPYLDGDGDPVADRAQIAVTPEFAVSIVEAPESVEPGESIELGVEVTNRGTGAGEAPVVLDAGEQEGLADESVALGPGESTTLALSFDAPQDAGNVDLTVRIDDPDVAAPEDGSDAVTVPIEEPAAFAVTNVDAPEAVEAGEPIGVAAAIENVGDATGEQEVVLEVAGQQVASESIQLDGGEETTATFDVPTDEGDVGTLDVAVVTADDAAAASVTVEEPGEPAFGVTNLEVPQTVEAGEWIEVAAAIENVGDAPGEGEVALEVAGQTIAAEPVQLDAGQGTTVTFDVPTDEGDVGTLEVAVLTADDGASTSVAVEEPGEPAFAVTSLEAPQSVEAGASFEVVAEVTNEGEAAGEGEVTLDVGADQAVAADVFALEPGETGQLVVEVPTFGDDVGDLQLTVRTADDQASTTVEVTEPPGSVGSMVRSVGVT